MPNQQKIIVEYWIRLNETNSDVRMYTLIIFHTLKNLQYVVVHAVQVDDDLGIDLVNVT